MIKKVESQMPEESKTRIHAKTPNGEITFCFDCDSTMCGNEVIYPENPNWDEAYIEEAKQILQTHPDFKNLGITHFVLIGSTRRYIQIDALVENPEQEGKLYVTRLSDGREVRVTCTTREMINRMYGEDSKKMLEEWYHQLKI